MRAGAGGRIGDLSEVRFLEQDELRVARDTAREARPAGRARAVYGSTVMASAPPRPAAATAIVVRSMFT